MISPIDDDWHHLYFACVGHPEIEAIAAEIGCGTFKVYHASGSIEMLIRHEKIKPVSWDLAEFKRLVAERIGVTPEKPQIMAAIGDDDDIPF